MLYLLQREMEMGRKREKEREKEGEWGKYSNVHQVLFKRI